jgi:hypothetical protein
LPEDEVRRVLTGAGFIESVPEANQ